MSNLIGYSYPFFHDTEYIVEVKREQSNYARRMVHLWQKCTADLLNLKLRNLNAAESAIKTIQSAIKYDLSDIVLLLSKRLMMYYPYRGDKKSADKYTQLVTEYLDIVNAETKAETYLSQIDTIIVKRLSNKIVLEELNKLVKDIDTILYDYHSLNFIIHAYKLKLRKAQLEGNIDLIVELSHEAMARLKQKPFKLPHVVHVFFSHSLIPIHIEKQEYEEAARLIQESYTKIKKGTVNWFVIHSFDVILRFQMLDFEQVTKLLNQFKRYDNDIHRNRYQLYEGYLSLFSKRKFKLGKFTNDLFEFSKDRQGYRVNIIIIQMLHLLKYKKYGQYIDRVEAIQQHMYRYLSSTDPKILRNRYFIKILLLLPDCDFNRIAFERKSADLYKKLKNTPREVTKQLLEQEPINYNYLFIQLKQFLK